MDNDKFKEVALENIPRDASGFLAVNLYVHLPAANRFVCYVVVGDELTDRKIEAIKVHVDPKFYVLETTEVGEGHPVKGIRIDAYVDEFKKTFVGEKLDLTGVRIETVSKEKQQELRGMYRSILDTAGDDTLATTSRLAEMSDDIIKVVAPEVKDIKAHLMRNVKYLSVMNDASAIVSLAVLFALANGFDSQKSYKELSYATLIMDLSLAEFDHEIMEQYFKDPAVLPADVVQKIRQHPERSHQLATQKLKSLTDVTKQLILTHHELYNGKGYPRGIRNESIFPVARILSMAVDVFEVMKKEMLTTGKNLEIVDVLRAFIDEHTEPHLRRHNIRLVQTTLKFLTPDSPSDAKA